MTFLENYEHGDLFSSEGIISISRQVAEKTTLNYMDLATFSRSGSEVLLCEEAIPAGFIINGEGKYLRNKKFVEGSFVEIFQQGRIFLNFEKFGLNNDDLTAGTRFHYIGSNWESFVQGVQVQNQINHKLELPPFPISLEKKLTDIRKKLEKKEDSQELQNQTLKAIEEELLEIEKSQEKREANITTYASSTSSSAYILLEKKFSNGWGCYVNFL